MSESFMRGSSREHLHEVTIVDGCMIREFCTLRNSTIGADCKIYERVSIKKSIVGERCEINAGTYIENAEISTDVQIGPNCSIVGVYHEITKRGVKKDDSWNRIIIKERAFIGAGAIVLPGIVIGEGAVIAAGAIISKCVPPYSICIGSGSGRIMETLEKWLQRKE